METINWKDFEKVEMRVGTIFRVENFPEAKKPAYQVWVNLGPDLGVKKSSAQITALYTREQLLNRQVICVCNFPKKQIAGFMSEVLITGFPDEHGDIVLAATERRVPDGSRLL